eukprot:SAG31_NODE_13800_length_846_cov_1.048193_2_plen_119_part_01
MHGRVWPPAVNQVELHPYYPQVALRAYCKKHGIIVQAYASLGGQDAGNAKLAKLGGPLLNHPAVRGPAEQHGVTPAQVLLAWARQHGVAVVPKSRSSTRIATNRQLHGIVLTSSEMAAL